MTRNAVAWIAVVAFTVALGIGMLVSVRRAQDHARSQGDHYAHCVVVPAAHDCP